VANASAVIEEVARALSASVRVIAAYDMYVLLSLPGADLRREIAVYDSGSWADVFVAAGDYRGYAGQPRTRGARPADFDGRYYGDVAQLDEEGKQQLRALLEDATRFLVSLTPESVTQELPREESPESPVYRQRALAIEEVIRPTVRHFATEIGGEAESGGMDWEKAKWTRGEMHLDIAVWFGIGHRARPFVGFGCWIWVWRRFGLLKLGQGPEDLGGPGLRDLRLQDWRDAAVLRHLLEEAKWRIDGYVTGNLARRQGIWRTINA
jgi:hypothetical protein